MHGVLVVTSNVKEVRVLLLLAQCSFVLDGPEPKPANM
jgi:hypothetical protein